MTDAVQHDPDFDFWDFVACALCHLPFSPSDKGPPPVPFWITECGHVLCNSHLNPDQTCAKCGDHDIQLMPLQRNIDPPMSGWFQSLPHAIDSMANAIKFQQASLAALVRHYRNQCLQLSLTCDRLRNERRSLRKEVEVQQRELHMYRNRGSALDQTPEHLNHNGKRPIAEVRGSNSSVKTNSSPMPLAPLRLTLPPGKPPSFTQQEPSGQGLANTVDRPGSSRQFAYHGQDNSRARPPPHEQQSVALLQPRFATGHAAMAPPPPPVQGNRFKPVSSQAHLQVDEKMESSISQAFEPHRVTNISENMGPPPVPQRPFSAALRPPSRILTSQANRFMHTSSHRGVTSIARTTAAHIGKASGGNRMPFMPPQSLKGFG